MEEEYQHYMHMAQNFSKSRRYSKRNQAVLKVGSTGYSTGAHAHFEVRKNGTVTNPMPYITNGIVPNSEEDKAQQNDTKETTNTTTENKTENKEIVQQ